MTLSSDQSAPCGLDAMLIVYSLLGNHPTSDVCEAFIRENTSWFTTTLTLLEAKAILKLTTKRVAAHSKSNSSVTGAGPSTSCGRFLVSNLRWEPFTLTESV